MEVSRSETLQLHLGWESKIHTLLLPCLLFSLAVTERIFLINLWCLVTRIITPRGRALVACSRNNSFPIPALPDGGRSSSLGAGQAYSVVLESLLETQPSQ